MDNFNKIGEIIKNNYKIIIPIILRLVLFIAFFVYYKISILDNYRKDTKDYFYQYFYGKKYEYNGVVTTNRHNVIVDFKTSDYDIKFDSTPIYYQKRNQVIFPKDMSVVMPTLSCSEYLAHGYSSINYSKNNYILTSNKYNGKLGSYFLYDGGDVYFFLDSVSLKIGDKAVNLSPMSYLIASYGKYVSYYDKKSDKFVTIQTSLDDVLVEDEHYKIYVMRDQVDYYGTEVVLTSKISNLNTIDMKDNK